MGSEWRWYGVKTLYREEAKGRPRGRDSRYVKGLTLVEERLVLFKARSGKEALRKAEREARQYVKRRGRNRYGQLLVTRYTGYCEAYDMSPDVPDVGVEVFSALEVIPRSLSDRRVFDRCIGHRERNLDRRLNHFGDIEFMGPALGVALTAKEKAFIARGRAFVEKRRRDA